MEGSRYGGANWGTGSADACLLAGGELSFGGANLFEGQSAFGAAACFGRHQAAAFGALGHNLGVEFYLYALEPGGQRARLEHDVHHRAGAWRAGDCGAYVSGGFVYGDLSAY